MNLQDLTGYESGLVIFKETDEAIITNWSSINGIPRVFVTGIIGLGDGDDLEKTEDINGEYYDMAIELATEDEEIPEIDGVWENDDVVVITFKGWV